MSILISSPWAINRFTSPKHKVQNQTKPSIISNCHSISHSSWSSKYWHFLLQLPITTQSLKWLLCNTLPTWHSNKRISTWLSVSWYPIYIFLLSNSTSTTFIFWNTHLSLLPRLSCLAIPSACLNYPAQSLLLLPGSYYCCTQRFHHQSSLLPFESFSLPLLQWPHKRSISQNFIYTLNLPLKHSTTVGSWPVQQDF